MLVQATSSIGLIEIISIVLGLIIFTLVMVTVLLKMDIHRVEDELDEMYERFCRLEARMKTLKKSENSEASAQQRSETTVYTVDTETEQKPLSTL